MVFLFIVASSKDSQLLLLLATLKARRPSVRFTRKMHRRRHHRIIINTRTSAKKKRDDLNLNSFFKKISRVESRLIPVVFFFLRHSFGRSVGRPPSWFVTFSSPFARISPPSLFLVVVVLCMSLEYVENSRFWPRESQILPKRLRNLLS